MLRLLAAAFIFYASVNGSLPGNGIFGLAPETAAALLIALLLAPTVGRLME